MLAALPRFSKQVNRVLTWVIVGLFVVWVVGNLLHAPGQFVSVFLLGLTNVGAAIWAVNAGHLGASGGNIRPANALFRIGGVPCQAKSLVVVLITIPVLLVLTYVVRKTKQGKAMRAVAQDMDASRM